MKSLINLIKEILQTQIDADILQSELLANQEYQICLMELQE